MGAQVGRNIYTTRQVNFNIHTVNKFRLEKPTEVSIAAAPFLNGSLRTRCLIRFGSYLWMTLNKNRTLAPSGKGRYRIQEEPGSN